MKNEHLTRGDIVLISTSGVIAEVIRFFENVGEKDGSRSEFNHVGLYVGAGNIIEAALCGIRVFPLDRYLNGKNRVLIAHNRGIPKNPTFEDGKRNHIASLLVSSALTLLGRPYGYWSIGMQALDNLTRTNLFTRFLLPKRMEYNCSQLVARVYWEVCSIRFSGTHWRSTTPDDIADEIHRHPDSWSIVLDSEMCAAENRQVSHQPDFA